MRRALTTSIIILIFLAASLPGQEGRFREAVEVTLVEVPVTVADRDGNPVRNLTRDDFVVLDQGKRVPISYFEMIDLTKVDAEASGELQPLHPAARRLFVILFDLANSSPGKIERAREAAAAFVENQMQTQDLALVATFSVEQGVRFLTNFTTDRQMLGDAVATLGLPSYFKVADPLMLTASAPPGADVGSTGAGAEVAQALVEYLEDQNRSSQQRNDDFLRRRLRAQLQNFAQVARVLDSVKGQKQILLLSEGFDARLVQGRTGDVQQQHRDLDASARGEIWAVDNDQRFGNVSSSNEINLMAEFFKRSDVVLHAFDISGLRSDVDAAQGYRRNSADSLHLITSPTGGTVFKNANDLEKNFDRLLKRQEVIYVLGFQAASTGKPGEFHELKVSVEGIRGAKVQHRSGYHELTPEVSPFEKVLSTAEILLNDVERDDLSLDVLAVAFPAAPSKVKAEIPVLVEISGPEILGLNAGSTTTAELFIYAFTPEGGVADFLHQQITLEIPKVRETLEKGGLRYYGTLHLPAGNYAIKTLVQIAGSPWAGFRRVDLRIPTPTEAAISSPLFFGTTADWILLRGKPGESGKYPFRVSEPFIPETRPTLSDARKLALFTYNVPAEDLEVSAVARNAGGEAVPVALEILGRTEPDELGATKLLFQLDPSNMPSGDYTLHVTVGPKVGVARSSSASFIVQ